MLFFENNVSGIMKRTTTAYSSLSVIFTRNSILATRSLKLHLVVAMHTFVYLAVISEFFQADGLHHDTTPGNHACTRLRLPSTFRSICPVNDKL